MEGPRLKISERLARILDYPRFAGPTRMLILDTNYFFEQSWIRAARTLGWQAESVPSVMVGGLTREDVQKLFVTIAEFKPDFILASNYAGMDNANLFARFFEDARIPYVSWFTDTPRMILFSRELYLPDYVVAATWERAYHSHFEDLGFKHIFYMPLATDPALFSMSPAQTWARPLSFVGTSMIEETNEAWEKLEHLPEVIRAILAAFEAGHVTREAFSEGIDAILPAAILANRDATERRNIELGIVYEATRRQRAEMILRLKPYDVEVRGDPAWAGMVDHVGGSVAYHTDLAGYYRDTAVNLNSTSLQMRWAVNQRVFDCPAAGGFLLSDAQQDLRELFEADEVATYDTLDELEDKAAYYLRHPEERTAMVLRAQRRITAHHTHAHRLLALEAFLKERFAG